MYRVEIGAKGGYLFEAHSRDGSVVIDIKGGGMTPPDLLLASLGGCIGVYVRKYAEGAKLPMPDFTITVEGDLGSQSPYYFRKIEAVVNIKGDRLDQRRADAMTEFIKNCPVHNTLERTPDVAVKIVQG